MVRPYDAGDVYAALNRVYPYDWEGFFRKRLYDVAPQLSLEAIHSAGYDLVFTDENNAFLSPFVVGSFTYGRCGLALGADGTATDVLVGGDAYKKGINVGDKVTAVDGKPFSAGVFREALTHSTGAVTLQIGEGSTQRTVSISCPGGPIIPHLKRKNSTRDFLAAITAPLRR